MTHLNVQTYSKYCFETTKQEHAAILHHCANALLSQPAHHRSLPLPAPPRIPYVDLIKLGPGLPFPTSASATDFLWVVVRCHRHPVPRPGLRLSREHQEEHLRLLT